jgi:hypothetical protein
VGERGGGGGNGVREGVTERIFIVDVLSIYIFSYNPWFLRIFENNQRTSIRLLRGDGLDILVKCV